MNYFKAEINRLTKMTFNRNALIYTSITALIVMLFRLYSPSLQLYREPNGFGLFAYTLRAIAFIWTLFLVFFLGKQSQFEFDSGMTRQILTTQISRGEFAKQRWLVASVFWGGGFVIVFFVFFLLAGLLSGYGDIAEQKYIFYSVWKMDAVVLLSLLFSLISLFTLIGVIQVLLLLLGNPGILPALILMLGLFFAPENSFLSYVIPGIHIGIFPGIIENMSNMLPVDFSATVMHFFINNLVWITILYFVQIRLIKNKDFS